MEKVTTILKQAIAFHQTGNALQAEQLYREVLRISPDCANALCMLGVLASQAGQLSTAIDLMNRAVVVAPEIAEAHRYLGNTLTHHGLREEAIACYRNAIARHPKVLDFHFYLGDLLRERNDHKFAIVAYQSALEIDPACPEAHNNLGLAYVALRMLDAAVQSFSLAVELRPDFAEAHFNLSCAYRELSQFDLAIATGHEAHRLRPGLGEAVLVNALQQVCDWRSIPELSNHLIQRVETDDPINQRYPIHPFAFFGLHLETTAPQQLKCARQWSTYKGLNALASSHALKKNARARTSKHIRLGYLSADYREHPVAYLIADLFEKHDRNRFEVFGYALGPDDQSAMRKRIANGFDRFHDIQSHTPIEAAQQIYDDQVDILIDLQGYTFHARTEVLALRPAPIQVNYLGYPSTMGGDFIDYILVDEFIVPTDQQAYYSERLLHLSGCYQSNVQSHPVAERIPRRTECGLPEEGFVFCSFNNVYKITPLVFDIWMRLLRSEPSSVLWLLDANPIAVNNLRREAASRSVDPERLVFAPRLPLAEHLARHRLADLFLDSFPINAHTTASDALRMNLPIVSIAGKTFASRVAGSLLRTVGLPELITNSYREYEALASRLAQDPKELGRIRQKLAQNLVDCRLFDSTTIARNIETAYETMWDTYRRNQSS
ncbi:MAG: tetratricopeptide repeat protein [Pirellulaceae bacterium]|nr:tetratricopeptide repeat protein [Pirellulaceae bacterium]